MSADPENSTISVSLNYGASSTFPFAIPADRLTARHAGPAGVVDVAAAAAAALRDPLDYPRVSEAVTPDDQVVIALGRHTPGAPEIVAALWNQLEVRGLPPDRLLILEAADWMPAASVDPRAKLPPHSRSAVSWKRHDATASAHMAYLASSASGERIYLARDVVDADFVIPCGPVTFDPVLGLRGLPSVLYPGLSKVDAFEKSAGGGHRELSPEDDRPYRQLVNEAQWLLGAQFGVGVVPSTNPARPAAIVAGQIDSVGAKTSQLLAESWRAAAPARCHTVVVSVGPGDAALAWSRLGAALSTACNWVRRGGNILVISDLAVPANPAIEALRQSHSPEDVLPILRNSRIEGFAAATQIAQANQWAKVYVRSQWPDDLLEDLLMLPLANDDEARRALAGAESYGILEQGDQTFAEIAADSHPPSPSRAARRR